MSFEPKYKVGDKILTNLPTSTLGTTKHPNQITAMVVGIYDYRTAEDERVQAESNKGLLGGYRINTGTIYEIRLPDHTLSKVMDVELPDYTVEKKP